MVKKPSASSACMCITRGGLLFRILKMQRASTGEFPTEHEKRPCCCPTHCRHLGTRTRKTTRRSCAENARRRFLPAQAYALIPCAPRRERHFRLARRFFALSPPRPLAFSKFPTFNTENPTPDSKPIKPIARFLQKALPSLLFRFETHRREAFRCLLQTNVNTTHFGHFLGRKTWLARRLGLFTGGYWWHH